ncbi:MAG TPA: Gldg family protein [Candidatus Dormibacteraeota bacterium]|nr:Gldg family protein [Candidatus Dormibacteraeota bacterium]
MKINRGELFKSISYGGAALAVAGYLRSTIEGLLSPLDMGLMIGGGALLAIAIAFNLGSVGRFFTRRSSRMGANTLVMVLAVLAILTAVNVVGFRHDKRFDLSSGKLYSLSQESRKIAGELKTNVDFIYFSSQPNPTMAQRMAEYTSLNHHIHFQRIDPVAHPDEAKQYGVRSMGDMVAVSGARSIHLQGTSEEDITNTLIQLTHHTVKTVCFVEGHGEKSIDATGAGGYSNVKDELTKESYKVQPVNLVSSNGVPDACTVLVIAGPTQAFFPQETTMVEKYLNDGGKAFILADPETHTGLSPIFQAWNINVGDNIVIDASGVGRLFGTGPAVPLVHDYGDSPITEGFQGTMTFFPLARTVSIADPSKNTDNEVRLLNTSSASWATPKITGHTVRFNPAVDTKGPLTLGITADRKVGSKEARLVVIGNSTFATNRWEGLQRNGDLFYNTVNWLSREESLISIRPKSPTNRRVTMTESQQRLFMWFCLALLPGLFVIGGIWIWWKRR